MPRQRRKIVGGHIYHLLNRANAKSRIFQSPEDYRAFERVWREANSIYPMRLLAYCVMPNHWHFVVWPPRGEDQRVSNFMHWMTMTHTLRYHKTHGTGGAGHLYQARFKAFPIQTEEYLTRVLRYVERNPLRAGLVASAEDWRWCSLWKYYLGAASGEGLTLEEWPVDRPRHWVDLVNTPQTRSEEQAIRQSMTRGRPYGSPAWTKSIAEAHELQHTLRRVGRPRKKSTVAK